MAYLVTGGAGFIGSAVVRALLRTRNGRVVNLDALTYAGNLDSLESVASDSRYAFEHVDIRDAERVRRVLETHRPAAILHLAAESHVDRSIDAPLDFVSTNVMGTGVLLVEARRYLGSLPAAEASKFRFVHVSTDEVYGSLGPTGHFTEQSPYDPGSPYSASKASSDHMVRAWHRTYGLPAIVTNCSNNYGPHQFPEKLIPLMILNALERKSLPVYGQGANVRDWLYVDDHAAALIAVLERGRVGETYAISGENERRNLDVVHAICDLVDEMRPDPTMPSRRDLVRFVPDRPGHDMRYAIDAAKLRGELGWRPSRTFEQGLRDTVRWYLDNARWWQRVRSGVYRGERLGLGAGA